VARSGHQAVNFDSRIYFYGGTNDGGFVDGIHTLDTKSMKWEAVQAKNLSPPLRTLHSMNVLDTSIYVWGGARDKRFFSDMWRFDLRMGMWEEIEQSGDIPHPRVSHTCTLFKDKRLLLFGGMCPKVKARETFVLFFHCLV